MTFYAIMDSRASPQVAALTWVCHYASELLEKSVVPRLGRYEADVTASALTLLAIRHAEGVAMCAFLGYQGAIPAAAAARASFEIALTAIWLQVPEDPFAREGRWLGYYKAVVRYYRNLASDLRDIIPDAAADYERIANQSELWRSSIESALPAGYNVVAPAAVPSKLEEIGAMQLYPVYRHASQIVHGEPAALDLVHRSEYDRDDPTSTDPVFRVASRTAMYGDFTRQQDLDGPLRMASYGVTRATVFLATRAGLDDTLLQPLISKHGTLLLATGIGANADESSGFSHQQSKER
jgi:hypothetical protein